MLHIHLFPWLQRYLLQPYGTSTIACTNMLPAAFISNSNKCFVDRALFDRFGLIVSLVPLAIEWIFPFFSLMKSVNFQFGDRFWPV